jgi:hypothetical protein
MSSRARQASDALTTALIIMASQGLRPNRSDPKFHWMWLSEHPAERQQAAPPVPGAGPLNDLARRAPQLLRYFATNSAALIGALRPPTGNGPSAIAIITFQKFFGGRGVVVFRGLEAR